MTDVRDTLRAHGWRAGHPGSGIEELWQHPSGPAMGWWTLNAAVAQLAYQKSQPSQSTNARPCNCDQALEAEEKAGNMFAEAHRYMVEMNLQRVRAEKAEQDALNWKASCMASDELGSEIAARLEAIRRILCDLVSAPSLSVALFADPTLERIRLAMLGRVS